MRHPPRRRPPRRPAAGPGCLGQIARLGVGLLVVVALYGLLARPQLSAALGRAAADLLAPAGPAAAAGAPPLPDVVAALPAGELVLSEQELNGYLAGATAYAPVEQARVQLSADRATVSLRAYGLDGVVSSGVAAVGGELVLVDPQIAGPLGAALSPPDLAAALVGRVNAELARQGRVVTEARIEDGRIVIVTSER